MAQARAKEISILKAGAKKLMTINDKDLLHWYWRLKVGAGFWMLVTKQKCWSPTVGDILHMLVRRRRMFATNRFVTSACSGQSVTSRLRSITSWHMFVTVNVSFNAYACHEVHFVAKFIWPWTYVPKSSRHEVNFHPNIQFLTFAWAFG